MWHLDKSKDYDVYVIQNATKSWFKFGVSTDIEKRLTSLGKGRKVYHRWENNNAWTALFLEDMAVSLAQEWDFVRYADDWFEIDEASVKVIIECITELREAVRQWSLRNHCIMSLPDMLDVPYGQHLRLHKAHGLQAELAETVAKFNTEQEQRWRLELEERRARAARNKLTPSGIAK